MNPGEKPPLRRIHSDRTLEAGSSRFSLEYWRGQSVGDIIASLEPGTLEALRVKPDGRVMNGNTRIKGVGGARRGRRRPSSGVGAVNERRSKTDVKDAAASFSALEPEEQARFLALLAHELTVAARDAYEVGADGLNDPARARAINEVQHRVTGHLVALLRGDPARYPDDVLFGIVLEQQDAALRQRLLEAFDRAVSLTTP